MKQQNQMTQISTAIGNEKLLAHRKILKNRNNKLRHPAGKSLGISCRCTPFLLTTATWATSLHSLPRSTFLQWWEICSDEMEFLGGAHVTAWFHHRYPDHRPMKWQRIIPYRPVMMTLTDDEMAWRQPSSVCWRHDDDIIGTMAWRNVALAISGPWQKWLISVINVWQILTSANDIDVSINMAANVARQWRRDNETEATRHQWW